MQFPTIHNNGSDHSKLITDFHDAADLICEAIDFMESNCGPHARDYFEQQPTANFEAARAEHTARVQALIKVRGELLSMVDNIEKQVFERSAARLEYRAQIATLVD